MNPHVTVVEPVDNYALIVHFENNEIKRFDVEPYLNKGIFQELKDINYFKRVAVSFGSVEWPHEQDFSYDTLYLLGETIHDGLNASLE